MQEVGRRDVKKVPTLRGRTLDQPVLRVVDAHAHLLRDRRQAALGGRGQLLAVDRRASPRPRASSTPRDARRDGPRRGDRAPQGRGRAEAHRRRARGAGHQRRRRRPRAPDPGAARPASPCSRRRAASTGSPSRSSATSCTPGWRARTLRRSRSSAPRCGVAAPPTMLPAGVEALGVEGLHLAARGARRRRRGDGAAHPAASGSTGCFFPSIREYAAPSASTAPSCATRRTT